MRPPDTRLLMALGIIALVALLILVLFPIRNTPPEVDGTPSEVVTFAAPQSGMLGLLTWVVKDQQFDSRHGLNLSVQFFAPAEGESALLHGAVDVGYFPPFSALRANKEGADIRLFGPALYDHYTLLVPSGSSVTTLSDLRGKQLGSMPEHTGGYIDFAVASSLHGLDLRTDADVRFASGSALFGLLSTGDLDAVVLYEPLTARAVVEGEATSIASTQDLWTSAGKPGTLLLIGFAAHDSWLVSHSSEARQLLAAFADARDYLLTNTESVLADASVHELLGTDDPRSLARLGDVVHRVYPDPEDHAALEDSIRLLTAAAEHGFIKEAEGNAQIFAPLR